MKTMLFIPFALAVAAIGCASSNATEDSDSSNAAVAYWGASQHKIDEALQYDDTDYYDDSPRALELKAADLKAEVVRDIVWADGEPTFIWAQSKDMGRLKCYLYNSDQYRPDIDTRRVPKGTRYEVGIFDIVRTWKAPRYSAEIGWRPAAETPKALRITITCNTDNGRGFSPPTDDVSIEF